MNNMRCIPTSVGIVWLVTRLIDPLFSGSIMRSARRKRSYASASFVGRARFNSAQNCGLTQFMIISKTVESGKLAFSALKKCHAKSSFISGCVFGSFLFYRQSFCRHCLP